MFGTTSINRYFLVCIILAILLSITLGFQTSNATPSELSSYSEPIFNDDNSPKHSPFGGQGLSYTTITTYFNDYAYYQRFGIWHKALDLVPSQKYYQENGAYKITHQPILFATCSGIAHSFTDTYGANVVAIECNDSNYRVEFVHEKEVFINKEGELVSAGMPIGIMGSTGKAYGAHVHYAIYQKAVNIFIPIDPLTFISS